MRFSTLAFALLLAGCQLVGPGADGGEIPHTVPFDDSRLSAEDRAVYREIAAHLTVQYLDAHPEYPAADEIALPQAIWDAYYHFLLHLGESEAFAQTGARYPALLPAYSLESVVLKIDTTQAWTRTLHGGTIPTGHAPFDQLAEKYGFHRHAPVTRFWEWLSVETDTLYNMRALLPLLRQVPGVEYAEVNGYGGDGNRLLVEPEDEGWRVDYYVGGGDCPAGCTIWQKYVFIVMPGGMVRPIETSNEGPPRTALEPRVVVAP